MASPLTHTLPVGANKLIKDLKIIGKLTEHFIVPETHLENYQLWGPYLTDIVYGSL